jgi:hypothetical protein
LIQSVLSPDLEDATQVSLTGSASSAASGNSASTGEGGRGADAIGWKPFDAADEAFRDFPTASILRAYALGCTQGKNLLATVPRLRKRVADEEGYASKSGSISGAALD